MAALPLQTTWRDTKPLLFQAVPPLDLAYLSDGLKNAFIIPPKRERNGYWRAQVKRTDARIVTAANSRCWANTRTGVRVHLSEGV